jgi:hypothetical protein
LITPYYAGSLLTSGLVECRQAEKPLRVFRISDFAHVRVPGWIAGQNNSSLQRVEGSTQRGLIRSI